MRVPISTRSFMSRLMVVSTADIGSARCWTKRDGKNTEWRRYRRYSAGVLCSTWRRFMVARDCLMGTKLASISLNQRFGPPSRVLKPETSSWCEPAKFSSSTIQLHLGLVQPGVGRAAAIWLYESGMAVLGTDTASTEPVPFINPALSTHRAMLVDSGVHLIENLNLEELIRDGVTEGLFIALPLKITGGTGSWVRPVVII